MDLDRSRSIRLNPPRRHRPRPPIRRRARRRIRRTRPTRRRRPAHRPTRNPTRPSRRRPHNHRNLTAHHPLPTRARLRRYPRRSTRPGLTWRTESGLNRPLDIVGIVRTCRTAAYAECPVAPAYPRKRRKPFSACNSVQRHVETVLTIVIREVFERVLATNSLKCLAAISGHTRLGLPTKRP